VPGVLSDRGTIPYFVVEITILGDPDFFVIIPAFEVKDHTGWRNSRKRCSFSTSFDILWIFVSEHAQHKFVKFSERCPSFVF